MWQKSLKLLVHRWENWPFISISQPQPLGQSCHLLFGFFYVLLWIKRCSRNWKSSTSVTAASTATYTPRGFIFMAAIKRGQGKVCFLCRLHCRSNFPVGMFISLLGASILYTAFRWWKLLQRKRRKPSLAWNLNHPGKCFGVHWSVFLGENPFFVNYQFSSPHVAQARWLHRIFTQITIINLSF